MIGMYVEDWSGETESTRTRGSTDAEDPSPPGALAAAFAVVLLMSARPSARSERGPRRDGSRRTHNTGLSSSTPPTRLVLWAEMIQCRIPGEKGGALTLFHRALVRIQTLRY